MPLTEAEWAYIAGFFDGEGCITIVMSSRRSGNVTTPRIYFAQKNLSVLDHISHILGFGRIYIKRPNKPGRDETHRLQITVRADIRTFCEGVLPYVFLKKSQVMLMLEYLNLPHSNRWSREWDGIIEQKLQYVERIKILKHQKEEVPV